MTKELFRVVTPWLVAGAIHATSNLRAAGSAEILDAGPHSQEIHTLLPYLDAQGEQRYQTNRFTQLEVGLNYLSDKGTWEPSSIDIEPAVGGGATAWKGQHKVSFSGQLNVGDAIQMRLPDGQLLVSHVQGLAYYDAATGQSILFAEVKDSEAWLYPPNQILYPDAFQNVEADVRYTYTKGGLEQDIILREAPPGPEKYGLNPETTRLEVWTEFVEPPEPLRTAKALNAATARSNADLLVDETLDFGAMRLGVGKTFAVGEEDESLALVAKQWVRDGKRRFLVEAVQVPAVAESLQTLPPTKGGAGLRPATHERLQAMHALPVKKAGKDRGQAAKKMTDEKLLAMNSRPGLVLDYTSVNTSLTNYTFKSDTTYYVSGLATLYGTNNTFEGGTVLKFANTNTPKVVVNTPLTWSGTIYRPVVLTSRDDHSVGEKIGTNTLSGYYADTALDLEAGTANTTYTLAHLRIAYANKAIVLNQKSGHVLSHVQLVNCQNGINPTSTSFSLRNALFANVLTNFNGSSSTNRIEHLTVDGANWFNYNTTFSTANLLVTNSLLIAVTNTGSYTGTSVQTNTASGVFQTVLAGAHYLAASSSYRNAGTTGINATLAKELATMTTYPPLALASAVTNSRTLTPVAMRDTDTPDLGYHYAPLDYYLSDISITSSTLTLSNGVAIGVYGSTAFKLQNAATLVSEGNPAQMNRLVRYPAVQEQPTTYASATALVSIPSAQTTLPNLSFRFTDTPFLGLGGSAGGRVILDVRGDYLGTASLQDCWLRGAYFHVGKKTDDGTSTVSLVNNLVERGLVEFQRDTDNPHLNLTVGLWNNLWWNSTLTMYYDTSAFFNPTWTVTDNHFDNATATASGTGTSSITKSNNAYQNTTSLGGSGNITLTNFPYASVSYGLGPWYHGATNLVNQGSRNADTAALYHYTTQTAQTKETNSVVDIGFHYVAVDSNGNPLDADGDGVPDYLEDRNGNGSVNSGETSWNSAGDLGLRVLITEPKSNTNLP